MWLPRNWRTRSLVFRHRLMNSITSYLWDTLTEALADELLARVSAGEAVFCEHLEALAAA